MPCSPAQIPVATQPSWPEHQPLAPASIEQCFDHLVALLPRCTRRAPGVAVQRQVHAVAEQGLQVVDVGGVPRVSDTHTVHRHTFLLEDAHLRRPHLQQGVVVRADGAAGSCARSGRRPEDAQVGLREFRAFVRDLDHGRSHGRAPDALLELVHEDVRGRVHIAFHDRPRRIEPDPGGSDDLQAGGLRGLDHELDIASEVRRREVDDRVDAARLQHPQLLDRRIERSPAVIQPRIVLPVFPVAHHDVLVREREPQLVRFDLAEHRLNRPHQRAVLTSRRDPR